MSDAPTFLASAVAAAEQIVEGTPPVHSVTAELQTLATAVLAMNRALMLCRDNDRSATYGPGETRTDGLLPPYLHPGVDYAVLPRWQTPAEIIDEVLGARPSVETEAPAQPQLESAR